jgi:hypothetical protein
MLKLNYVYAIYSCIGTRLIRSSTYPKSGGAFKVQIYSPYIFMNKTGLSFDLGAKTWTGGQKPVAGRDMFAGELARADAMWKLIKRR